MPATMRSLTSKRNTLDIEIDGDPKAITVEYSTRKLTPRLQEEINTLLSSASPNDIRPTIRQFLVIITSWNFAPEDGKPPIPLEEEALMDVPLELLGIILDAVTADMSPKDATAT